MGRHNVFLPRLRTVLSTASAPQGLSQLQLCKLLDASQGQVSRNLARLRDAQPREAYICRWQKSNHAGGPPMPFYAPGDADDVPCTVRKMSCAERTRLYRERKATVRREPTVFEVLHQCFFGLGA